jgi:alpha-tubulin suppressor-like RCC1 family protein
MSLSKKTSVKIAQQLPEFVRDDLNYQNFVLFLEAYYEWLETQYTANANSTIVSTTSQGITYGSKNILNYVDVDETLDEFVQYFLNDFLPYIPVEISTDKRKLLKISKQFYQSKGTENSYKFLFKVLYDANIELFNTNDAVLRASDGKWIVPKYLRVDSTTHTEEMHMSWLNAQGFRIFGETSKSYAVIDYVAIVGDRTEIYISEIQNRFQAGENITVVDNNNFAVYFYDGEVYVQNQGYEIPMSAMPLTEKITGVVSAITLDPNYKGLFYNTGDPVVAYGGLDPNRENPVGLSAEIGDTNLGSLSALVVVNPSHGYRLPLDTLISITGGSGSNAAAQVSLLDESKFANLTLITSNTLGAVASVLLGNTTHPETYTFGGSAFVAPGNTNTTLANTLTFKTFVVAPIGSVKITNSGKNYSVAPSISAQSNYTTDSGTDNFSFLGILQPIQIQNGGINYGNSNTITIVGGTGFGAYANIVVNSAGSIISAGYIYESSNSAYPLGGLGYDPTYLPTVNVSSLSGSDASLIIPGVMAVGATFSPTTDTIGSIETINIIDGGEDYVSTPNLSLKVADVAVSNVSLLYPITSGDLIYQGTTLNTSYYAYVDSILKLSTAEPPNSANDVYQIRTYNYVGDYNSTLPLKIDKGAGVDTYTLVMSPSISYIDEFGNPTTIKRYGDGTARATASFLGGVITGQGKYLNDDGWISSLGRVLESKNYNKYTYVLSTTQALAKYKELVLNLVHTSGTRLIGRNLLKSENSFNFTSSEAFQTGVPLSYVAGSAAYASLEVRKLVSSLIETQISAGTRYFSAIKTDGTLWSCGYNDVGQLGLNTSTEYSSLVQVGALNTWTQIACGYLHSLALQSNGSMWGWGNNIQGQLGLSDTTDRSSPTQIGTLSTWTKVSVGHYHSLAIQSNGTLWSWGQNAVGVLGLSDLTSRSSPVQVGTESYWTQVVGGFRHSLALQSNGTLWAWGNNVQGQLGLGNRTNRSSPVQVGLLSTWTKITAGYTASAAIKNDGTLWSWGQNSSGVLGFGNTNRSSPVQVGTANTWAQIDINDSNSALALQYNGTIWAWGSNGDGQLGLGDLTNRSSPVQIGNLSVWNKVVTSPFGLEGRSSYGVKNDGTLWSWGSGISGQLGLNTNTDYSSPVQVGTEDYWVQLGLPIASNYISNNIIKLTNVIAGNIGNTIFANDIIEFSATNNIRAYSTITNVDWSNNQIYMQDNVFLTFANVAFASIGSSSNIININTLTGQYDGNFRDLAPANNIFFVGDTISLNNGGTFYTITRRFANGNFSINNSSLGPIANTRITVNKNANTQSVMIYGEIGQYDTPQLVTENEESLMTENDFFILIG